MDNRLFYEQPLNEYVRICLRLECLFNRLKRYISAETTTQSVLALSTLLELLGVVDRPDIRSRLGKALVHVNDHLAQLAKLPNAADKLDQSKLAVVLEKLQKISIHLSRERMRIGQNLYQNAFLKSVRYQLATPGGTCQFSAPEYHLWLNQPPPKRQADLHAWFHEFHELDEMVFLLLKLIRESAKLEPVEAVQGFYQRHLNTGRAGQMIRVALPAGSSLYPVFSVGRHLCSLHFYRPNFRGKCQSQHYRHNLSFYLAYCVL